MQSFHFQKLLTIRKKFTLKKNFKVSRYAFQRCKENDTFRYFPLIQKDNGNTFYQTQQICYYKNFDVQNNKFEIKTTEEDQSQIQNECESFFLQNVEVITVAKFLKDDAPVIAIHLPNINGSIKLDTFFWKCKIAITKPLF